MKKYLLSFIFLNVLLIAGILYTPYTIAKNNVYYNLLKDNAAVVYSPYGFTKDDLDQLEQIKEINDYDLVLATSYASYNTFSYMEDSNIIESSYDYYNPSYFDDVNIVEGRMFENESEAIVSQKLADEFKQLFNQSIIGVESPEGLKVVGVYDNVFNTSRVSSHSFYSELPITIFEFYHQVLAMDKYVQQIDEDVLMNINTSILIDNGASHVEIDCTDTCYIVEDNLTQSELDSLVTIDDYPATFNNYLYLTSDDLDGVISQIENINPNFAVVTNSFEFKSLIPASFYLIAFGTLILFNGLVFLPPIIRYKRKTFKIKTN